MIRVVNVCLFKVLSKTVVNISRLKNRSFITSTNLQINFLKSSCLCREYCTTKSNEGTSDEDYCDYEDIFRDVNFDEITNGDPELSKALKLLKLQIESYRHEGHLLPKNITTSKVKHLLGLSRNAKISYLKFLAKNEFKALGYKRRKEQQKLDYIQKKESILIPNHINYSVGQNALFMRINQKSVTNLLVSKVCTALLYSNDIVVDLDYEKYMTPRQMKECAKQIHLASDLNRDHINPLNIHVCNLPPSGILRDYINHHFFDYSRAHEVVHFHEESYLHVFDQKNLVYLSPHAVDELHEYNPEDVYIIGGYIDTGTSLPVSFGKAKAEKIRSAKLPLDVYFKWKRGKKSLPVNIVYNIMLDLNYYKNMKKALYCNVPTRLYYKDNELNELYSSKIHEKKKRSPQYKKEIHPCGNEEMIEEFEERKVDRKFIYHLQSTDQ